MSIVVRVSAHGRTSEFEESALPLGVGPGPAAAIPVPGADIPDLAAFIGHSGDRWYIQPAPGARGLEVNGEPLSGSRWLSAGDDALVGDATLTVEDAGPVLELSLHESEDVTAPPLLVDEPSPESVPAQDTIAAVEFRRQSAPPPSSNRRYPNR